MGEIVMPDVKTSHDLKYSRILSLYKKLSDGCIIDKAEEAKRFGVTVRSLQRDIEALRGIFSSEENGKKDLVYDHKLNGYYLKEQGKDELSDGDILTVCRVIIDSHKFGSCDTFDVIDKIIRKCVPKRKQNAIKELVSEELQRTKQ